MESNKFDEFMKEREFYLRHAMVLINHNQENDEYRMGVGAIYSQDMFFEMKLAQRIHHHIWIPLLKVESIVGMKWGTVTPSHFKECFNKMLEENMTGRLENENDDQEGKDVIENKKDD